MNAKQRDRHERKMYLKGLRYGARYEVITTPANIKATGEFADKAVDKLIEKILKASKAVKE